MKNAGMNLRNTNPNASRSFSTHNYAKKSIRTVAIKKLKFFAFKTDGITCM